MNDRRQITRLVAGVLALILTLTIAPSLGQPSLAAKLDGLTVTTNNAFGFGTTNSTPTQGTTVTIDWTAFPDGSAIPNETEITNQFQSLGIVFLSPPGPPRVLEALGGILISGGPTAFFGDIYMSFIDVGFGLPTSLTVEIIGSGLNISASLEAFDSNSNSLGTVIHTYTGPTGQLSPFTFSAPPGKRIANAIYNGGLNPSAAASIGTLIIHYSPFLTVPIDIKPGSDPNSINCNNENEVIAVAIQTTEEFDATTVDHTTVIFEGAGETHVDKKSGEPRRHEEDVDGDGNTDLVFHFSLGDTGLTCDFTEGTLTGETFDGQAIEGTDAIRMVD